MKTLALILILFSQTLWCEELDVVEINTVPYVQQPVKRPDDPNWPEDIEHPLDFWEVIVRIWQMEF